MPLSSIPHHTEPTSQVSQRNCNMKYGYIFFRGFHTLESQGTIKNMSEEQCTHLSFRLLHMCMHATATISPKKSFILFVFTHKNRLKVNAVFWCGVDFSFRNSLSSHYNCILTFLSLELGIRQKINLHYKNVYWQRSMTSS